MRIAIIGYGKMGHEIEKLALERNHQIILRIDENNINSITKPDFENVDIAIEFSKPESAFSNINLCFDNHIPVVSGTTGWLDNFNKLIERCTNEKQTFFYASNYSIGVNMFFKLNTQLANMMNQHQDYEVSIEETHHMQKIDAPSGTAISLAKEIIENIDRKNKWEKETKRSEDSVSIHSFREGSVPGNHKVIYESPFDKIMIEHDAKSRKGFALGAILAAEFILHKKGYYTMNDLLKF